MGIMAVSPVRGSGVGCSQRLREWDKVVFCVNNYSHLNTCILVSEEKRRENDGGIKKLYLKGPCT